MPKLTAPILARLPVALALLALGPGCQRAEPAKPTPAAHQQPRGAPATKPVQHMDAAAFAKAALHDGAPRAGVVVLDVRTPGEVARGHLPGARMIDSSDPQFTQKAGRMARDQPVYIYCHSGRRSAASAARLSRLGFQQVINLRGGISGWQRAGLPVVRD